MAFLSPLPFQMLGDIFLNFTTQLRAYTNFLNNYPVTLQTLERVSYVVKHIIMDVAKLQVKCKCVEVVSSKDINQ